MKWLGDGGVCCDRREVVVTTSDSGFVKGVWDTTFHTHLRHTFDEWGS